MASENCLVLHRKSANELKIKEAVRHVRRQGIDLRVVQRLAVIPDLLRPVARLLGHSLRS